VREPRHCHPRGVQNGANVATCVSIGLHLYLLTDGLAQYRAIRNERFSTGAQGIGASGGVRVFFSRVAPTYEPRTVLDQLAARSAPFSIMCFERGISRLHSRIFPNSPLSTEPALTDLRIEFRAAKATASQSVTQRWPDLVPGDPVAVVGRLSAVAGEADVRLIATATARKRFPAPRCRSTIHGPPVPRPPRASSSETVGHARVAFCSRTFACARETAEIRDESHRESRASSHRTVHGY